MYGVELYDTTNRSIKNSMGMRGKIIIQAIRIQIFPYKTNMVQIKHGIL